MRVHRMTSMTGPDFAVMCNLINTHTHTHIYTYTHERRPYSGTLYPTSFTLDSLLNLTISAPCKTYG